jgi:4a-hydroxytetrahydrobiopterin dehydratase
MLSRAKARNAALVNQLATPGLGSLMAGRWIAGAGQLALALAGFILIMVWFFKIIIPYYSLMFGESAPGPINWWTGELGAGLFVLAWFWSLVTSLSLLREASKVKLQPLKIFPTTGQMKFDDAQIQNALALVPQWQLNDGKISRTFQFKNFPAAMKFVGAVADLAEQAWHHPDIDIRWNKVTLALTTHDAGGLTEKDFALAQQFEILSLR